MTSDDLKEWRVAMGDKRGLGTPITQAQAAEALRLPLSTYQKYELPVRRGGINDGRPVNIPGPVALACAALLSGLPPYPGKGRARRSRGTSNGG